VREEGRAAEALGTLGQGARLDRSSMFDDVYKEIPPHLARQRAEMLGGR
jgi:2-oxoisovalerate dehydrogenase E1 component alpha subunit